ncbi:ABC transporter substrate-binding protein [Paenibacillus glacialis]|uniref:ABC transporter substrate-binding protein n=1 Tax=Paenibacillus glacialis TaxID=494026 RepID=A0A168C048_9BACL|nr:ABC transporter substrate-binding protein [Paenibacillus glacialis]OAB32932.1 ABC transporter substrate-binding protein [Paenibacillus glacialis]
MKVKKSLTLALVGTMLFSGLLAGCGSNNKTKEEATTAHPSGLKPYELKMYLIGGPQKDLNLVLGEINKYTKEKINATLDITMFDWGDYDKKMQVITASGEPYDIAFTASWTNDFRRNAANGTFMGLNDLLDKYGKETKAALDPRFLEGTKIKGEIYGVPVNKELGQQWVWRFNKKYLDKYKMDISNVRTLEDLEPLLKTIKASEPGNITPLAVAKNYKPYLPFDYVLGDELPIGVYMDSKDGKVVNVLETPELEQSLDTMRRFYQAGYLRPDVATLDGIDNIKTGQWFADREITQPYADKGWSRPAGYEIVSSPMHDPYVYTQSAAGSMHGISVTSGDPDRAMMFLNLLNTDKYLRNLINYGIEGTHYKKISENVIEDLPAMKDSYAMPGFSLGNMYLTYLHADEPADKWDAFKKFNDSATEAPTFGFAFDSTPVKTEVAAINNVSKEFIPALFTGSVDPKVYLPKATKKFKEAGLDKVIAEVQKQFDEWKATKK